MRSAELYEASQKVVVFSLLLIFRGVKSTPDTDNLQLQDIVQLDPKKIKWFNGIIEGIYYLYSEIYLN